VSRRLVLFEGVWGEDDLRRRAKDLAAEWLRRFMRVPHDHHAPYPEEALAELRSCAGTQFDPRVVEAFAKDSADELPPPRLDEPDEVGTRGVE
jgi:hypothetical protein